MKKNLNVFKSSLYTTILIFTLASTANASTTHVETDEEASRFLTQATFGPNTNSIKQLKELQTYEAWIDEQFIKPRTKLSTQLENLNLDTLSSGHMQAVWWNSVITKNDQLRQRMAYALSEIFVTGYASGFNRLAIEREHYYDLLSKNSFGNFRDLLSDVTLNPIMAKYLSMLNNKKANEIKNTFPDENYAREIMQLFTIGLVKLKRNGKVKKRDDESIATYTQDDVVNLARVFTGWTLSSKRNYKDPMICNTTYHDYGEKILLGKKIPANLSCEDDMQNALDILFNHRNTPIFISKQLIQKFTTSNPSGRYVKAVAKKFIDNGEGVRGDLKAVIKEILLHNDARKEYRIKAKFGKIKEPSIRLAALFRATNSLKDKSPTYLYSVYKNIGQTHLDAPSVFNYFSPSFAPKGDINNANKVAPELQLATDKYLVNTSNYYAFLTRTYNTEKKNRITLFLDKELNMIKNNPELFIEHFNTLLFAGKMKKNTKEVILEHINSIVYYENYDETKIERTTKKRASEALFLMMNAPEQNYIQ